MGQFRLAPLIPRLDWRPILSAPGWGNAV